jgi:RNA recognition motif-containing protein
VLLENRTIFVGDFGVDCTEDTLWQEFEVFGEIVQLRFLPQKSIAFVQYNWRSSAEFAKEAMSQQVVGEGSVVSVRWAKVMKRCKCLS